MPEKTYATPLGKSVLSELHRAQHLIEEAGDPDDIDPRFRVVTPEGTFQVIMTHWSNASERLRQLRILRKFMAWKLAVAIVMGAELHEPDSVFAVGVTHNEQIAAVALIMRRPLRFSPPQWLAAYEIDPELRMLLPKEPLTLIGKDIEELDEWFGDAGRFPAVVDGLAI